METTQDKARTIRLHDSWRRWLMPEFEKPHMRELKTFLQRERAAKKVIFPKGSDIFRALDTTPFDEVRVVILGQDPYHGPGQAHGLCFSVPEGVRPPPSLENIFKELRSDVGCAAPSTGSLVGWAEQGVLLLNATLTVEQGLAGSHQRRGWEQFTDQVIQVLNEHRKHIVFILWGAYAQKKGALIDRSKHCVIEGPHPSPLSAHRGFFGSRPFSKANLYLTKTGQTPIDWGRTVGSEVKTGAQNTNSQNDGLKLQKHPTEET